MKEISCHLFDLVCKFSLTSRRDKLIENNTNVNMKDVRMCFIMEIEAECCFCLLPSEEFLIYFI